MQTDLHKGLFRSDMSIISHIKKYASILFRFELYKRWKKPLINKVISKAPWVGIEPTTNRLHLS